MSWNPLKSVSKAWKGVTKLVDNAVGSLGSGLVSSVVKDALKGGAWKGLMFGDTRGIESAVKNAMEAANKVNKSVIKPVVDKGIDVGKNIVNSPIKTASSLAKGDIIGAATNLANTATMGTVDLTGRKQGIVNMDTKATIAKQMERMIGKAPSVSTSTPITQTTTTPLKKKGLLTQLRKGKGVVGGGSYTTTAKDPLGGASGKTGA